MSVGQVLEHLYLVVLSCSIVIAVGIPLGILTYYHAGLGKVILTVVDLIQTVPVLAVMGLLMAVFGANSVTVIAAMVLYLLLPVVRNTNTGLHNVNPLIRETADAMGMGGFRKLRKVEFPLAFPFILMGIRITVVNAVGVAVFGNFVGGGGLGSILYRGIRIQNMQLIIEGTLALVAISLCFDYLLGFCEKKIRRFI
ncbi:MAG: ABC transporter permease [Lachnospiraceae bacterium]